MSNHNTQQSIEITGTSTTTVEDAVENALSRMIQSMGRKRPFEIVEMRGDFAPDSTALWRVTLKVSPALVS